MSTINQALSELTDKDRSAESKIEKAHIKKVKSRPVLPWLIGGFSISLALGGWAVSQQSEVIEHSVLLTEPAIVEVELNSASNSDASSITAGSSQQVTIYQASNDSVELIETHVAQAKPVKKVAPPSDAKLAVKNQPKAVETKTATAKVSDTTLLLASNSQSVPKAKSQPTSPAQPLSSEKPEKNTIIIEQVELTPAQLAEKAEQRARKAIDSNNVDEALSGYKEALRYTPRNENIRQQLAALYYGKGDARQAFEILQEGIRIDNDSEVIRIALAKLLIKEQQHEAALTPLIHLNHQPSVDYLSLRAALAQKNNLDDIALETYQQLVGVDESNARWWLGLAIQQERNADMPLAQQAYQQALTKVGLSRQSQTFVRERLKLLATLQEGSSSDNQSSSGESSSAN